MIQFNISELRQLMQMVDDIGMIEPISSYTDQKIMMNKIADLIELEVEKENKKQLREEAGKATKEIQG